MGELLALASAVCYGVADFAGGLLARRAGFAGVAFAGQLGALVLTLLVAPVIAPGVPTWDVVGWGALSGLGTGVGMVFLYRGIGRGAMSVVVPVSAVTGIALPVLVAVVLLGDRPSVLAWLGVAAALPALWLVARRGGDGSSKGTLDAVLAGVGIAVQYLALAQAGTAAGIWPVVAGRLAATMAILPLAAATPAPARVRRRDWLAAAATGGIAALALVCYLAATGRGLVTVAVVLSSMYPAIPVILGVTVLRERLSGPQVLGLTVAAAAVTLLAVG